MMKPGRLVGWLLVISACAVPRAFPAAPVKLAIIAESSTNNAEADLLAVELSHNTNVVLLERAELNL